MKEGTVGIGRIGIYGAESLTCLDFLSLAHRCRSEAGVYRKVFAMAEHHNGMKTVLSEDR